MKKAFTLAEVLITLGIIGVVAALVMPSLIAKHQEKVTITKLKKVYSVLSSALQLAVNEHGTPDNWNLIAVDNPQGGENLLNVFAPYLIPSKKCGRNAGCLADSYVGGKANYNTGTAYAKLILSDGVSVVFSVKSPDCTLVRGTLPELRKVCATIHVDLNGLKPPNEFGKDAFVFNMTENSIIPFGVPEDTYEKFPSAFAKTAWVIINENMDYLRCNDLSWNGKTKCK